MAWYSILYLFTYGVWHNSGLNIVSEVIVNNYSSIVMDQFKPSQEHYHLTAMLPKIIADGCKCLKYMPWPVVLRQKDTMYSVPHFCMSQVKRQLKCLIHSRSLVRRTKSNWRKLKTNFKLRERPLTSQGGGGVWSGWNILFTCFQRQTKISSTIEYDGKFFYCTVRMNNYMY